MITLFVHAYLHNLSMKKMQTDGRMQERRNSIANALESF